MQINKEIFRAYDIRGNSLKDLTEEVAYKIGFCFAEMSISNDIVNSVGFGYKERGAKPITNRRATSNAVGESKSIDYNNKICVGLDGRLSSPTLCKALELGLTNAGAEIINIGVVPTPVLYFADKHFMPAGSIMVTGSHNPRDDNGFKILQNGKPFFGPQIQDLLTRINVIPWLDHGIQKKLNKTGSCGQAAG